jgi:hypothetical protein
LQDASAGGPEEVKTWRALQPWLTDPVELSAWRELARVLVRLAEPQRQDPDPVSELKTFLERDRFELSLKRLTLEIPDALKLRPDGKLSVVHRPREGDTAVLTFTVADKHHDAQRGLTTYTLRAEDKQLLLYRPGEELFAQLPARDAEGREQMLTWAISRSQVFQFERLVRAPRLHLPGQDNTQGQLMPGIRLMIAPGQGSIPPVPDLVPIVKLPKSK